MSSHERLEILKMVADKIITVEEAERLLRALSEGSEEAKEKPGDKTEPKEKTFKFHWEHFLNGIGPVVKDVVMNAVDAVIGEDESANLESVDPESQSITIEPDTELVVVSGLGNVRHCGFKGIASGGDITIHAGEGDGLTLQVNSSGVTVKKAPKKIVIISQSGDIDVGVPDILGQIRVKNLSGNIRIQDLKSQLSLKTMGGDLDLQRVRGEIHAKTMGGQVRATNLVPMGQSKLVTMGGNMDISFSPAAALVVKAVTMGGTITVAPELGEIHDRYHMVKREMQVKIGGVSDHRLTVHTMGGNIRLHPGTDEPVEYRSTDGIAGESEEAAASATPSPEQDILSESPSDNSELL